MKKIILLCTLIFFLIPFTSCLAYNLTDYEHEETRELIRFVLEAVEEIERVGEEAFPEFRRKEGKWFQDDSYIFVWGLDGLRYVYPPDVSGEGKNMLDLKDISGRPIGRMFVEIPRQPAGEGWVHYQWPRPGESNPTWKSTFIKRAKAPSGKDYLMGSGNYNMKCEKVFVIALVNRAISLLQEKGLDALEGMRAQSSQFILMDSYIFIKDEEANELLNIAFPELESTNVVNKQDSNGKYFVREVLTTLRTEDDCWIEYMWPKPGQTEPSRKLSYEKKVLLADITLIVGAGYYPD